MYMYVTVASIFQACPLLLKRQIYRMLKTKLPITVVTRQVRFGHRSAWSGRGLGQHYDVEERKLDRPTHDSRYSEHSPQTIPPGYDYVNVDKSLLMVRVGLSRGIVGLKRGKGQRPALFPWNRGSLQ